MVDYNGIKSYIQNTLKQGHSEKAIRKYLIDEEKISESLVNQAFKELSSKPTTKAVPITLPSTRTLGIIGAVILIILLIMFITSLFKGTSLCTDSACFIKNAQACKESTFVQDEVGSKMLYKIKSGCILEKSIQTFAADEPIEVITLFKDKKISCEYTQNNFDENLISSIVAGIDLCSGDLKDSIMELKLAQYELLT